MVIQAGGGSRRMGQDKALLPFLGQPLVQRIYQRVAEVADEILITTNQPEAYRFLGLRTVTDSIPGRGALGGLYSALQAAAYPLVIVLACDMPFVNSQLLVRERDLLLEAQADAVIPRTGSGLEPFHAVYLRETCLPAVCQVIQAGQWRVDAWFDQVRLRYIELEEIRVYDPQLLSFWNVNTPHEFQKAAALANELERKQSSV